jgi:hypothetical protein
VATTGSPSTLTNLLKQQAARVQTAQSLGISPPPRQPQGSGVAPMTTSTGVQVPAQPGQAASVVPPYSQQMFDATKAFLAGLSQAPGLQSNGQSQGNG